MKYTFSVEELLKRKVTVEAGSAQEARAKVQAMYDNEEIVLSADDFSEYGIYALTD